MHTIVIIDSEPSEISQMQRMLEHEDYRFESAGTGAGAKALLTALGAETSAIVVDWALPDLDGMELLGWIQSQSFGANLEVIVHSEVLDASNVEQAIDAGAYYFLTKPFEEPQLEAIVRGAVETVEQKQELERLARETRDAVRLLDVGVFRVRTVDEAELLAIHLASACGCPDLSLGIRELIVNAVEHGNLAITYDEKGRLLRDGCLTAELDKRLRRPEFAHRRVEVTLERSRRVISITIRDEGDGFDFEKYKTMDEARLFDLHGRGVLMATATLDLEYVPPGNQVRIRLPIDGLATARD